MSDIRTVCLGTSNSLSTRRADTCGSSSNWAAGFRAHGCRILWLDVIEPTETGEGLQHKIAHLKSRIASHGLADSIVLVHPDGTPLEDRTDCLSFEEAISADLLFDLRYDFPESVVKRFPRTALLEAPPHAHLQTTLFCLEGSRGRSRPLQHAKERVNHTLAGSR